ncbi:hypothetical protein CDAR_9911 [Caerostris darwini]|uniref:Uncharacterized protein n=1 Tax=Caerostris darwini TaxID=1538125 RepID=A0AAV4QXS6_9ARAC|nr:hypothetical protein CDAR_9911 [Caerostris darwini]
MRCRCPLYPPHLLYSNTIICEFQLIGPVLQLGVFPPGSPFGTAPCSQMPAGFNHRRFEMNLKSVIYKDTTSLRYGHPRSPNVLMEYFRIIDLHVNIMR